MSEQLNRHDHESCGLVGDTMALEVAIKALLIAFPDRERLASAWKEAEDAGFIWTSDPSPLIGAQREAWVKASYLSTLARLRCEALFPSRTD